ncbi:terpenoid cyclases/Protein prenyltransferase [Punctularia strigosozonata HHB-11173 SS5]|uniref:terpenoid cyclases/Protein prenyltransferase n=1 Tax=Punctularia strigosozonata (strain HHB-11173) TaxID=741275 RepID=UPI0004416F12|nr:terpenoid cyclases/Protein prenyltransferase [Punctularia strigosozonata HHB-11173 SS5]EIN06481.1 terpenoid cyclases/Protein prenyltransferase [Punctularia strigosozonata HHB-11173 SS5]
MAFRPAPSPDDSFPTETSKLQAETEDILIKHLPTGSSSPPVLQRNSHLQFLVRNLVQGFPAPYTSQDASQPWLMYWTLQGFSTLQVALDPANKQKVIDTVMAWQHPDGGFGGGPGQAAHLLPTYAAVCALAIAGRPGPGGGWDQINRKKMYDFFMSLKQPDGSFLVAHHAEVDVRGIYCLLVVAQLLDLLTPELVAGTASFVASCQTYEGGFSSASQPFYSNTSPSTLLQSPRPPLGEAHGGYTFCALAAWTMLQPFSKLAPEPKPKVDIKTLVRWLTHMQGSEAELGGFKGRTNKLVDGCYSWWVGGAFGLLEALGVGQPHEHHKPSEDDDEQENWDDVDDSLYNRKALQEYILYAGQHPAGGLRDKPPKQSDAYHTLSCLAGLSSAQHRMVVSQERREQLISAWTPSSGASSLPDGIRKAVFLDALSWAEEEGGSKVVGGGVNRVNATHPIYNLTMTHTEGIMSHFYAQQIPPRIKKA